MSPLHPIYSQWTKKYHNSQTSILKICRDIDAKSKTNFEITTCLVSYNCHPFTVSVSNRLTNTKDTLIVKQDHYLQTRPGEILKICPNSTKAVEKAIRHPKSSFDEKKF